MKKTVKILSFLCAIVMLLGILPIMSVSAAGAATLAVTPSTENVKAGKEFNVTVSLVNNPGIWGIKFNMPIDAEAFEFVTDNDFEDTLFEKGAGFSGYDVTNGYTFNRTSTDAFANITGDGALVVLTLRAKADADLTDYTFTATVDANNTVAINTSTGKTEKTTVEDASTTLEVVPNIAVSTIDSASISIGADISINYYVTLDEDHAGAQMRFTMNGVETLVDGVDMGGEYVYNYKGIAPQHMGDNIKAELIYDGDVVASKDNYSVLENCQNLLAASAEDLGITEMQREVLNTLIADLLVYGAKAQLYCNYNTESLVDAGVTGATALGAIADENDIKYTEGSSSATVAFTAAGVYFDYTNSLYFKFTAPDMTESNFKLVYVTYDEEYNAISSETYLITDCVLIDEATSTYVFYTPEVSALEFGTIFSAELYVKSGRNWGDPVQYLDYNVNSYAYAKQDSTDADMANLAKALYNYGVSAAAFLNSFIG